MLRAHRRSLARETGLPFCISLRGSPTAQILRGAHPEDRTREVIEVYRSAHLLIAVAQHLAQGLADRFAVERVRTVPNALDLDRFAPRPPPVALRRDYRLAAADRLVLLPGHLIRRKRPTISSASWPRSWPVAATSSS